MRSIFRILLRRLRGSLAIGIRALFYSHASEASAQVRTSSELTYSQFATDYLVKLRHQFPSVSIRQNSGFEPCVVNGAEFHLILIQSKINCAP